MNQKQAFIFFGIILAGLGISLFTLNFFGEKKVEKTDEPEPAPLTTQTEPESAPPIPEPKPEPEPEKPDGPPVFKSPEALVGALVEKIKNRDVDGFLEVVGEEAINPGIRPQVEGLLKDESWKLRPDAPMTQLAKSADSVRWSIHFNQSAGTPKPAAPGSVNSAPADVTTQLFTDLAASADKSEWAVQKIALPLDFAEKTGLTPGTVAMKPGEGNAPGTPGTPGATPGSGAPMPNPSGAGDADALTVAYAFSEALLTRNFDLARKLTDAGQVTDERVAALMIALEEGSFRLRENKPLIVTLAREDLTWVLTRVDSESAGSEFAVEMGKPSETAEWKIHGLTFSKLIAALAAQAGAGGVAYAPIVADPQGGDSLVLYFEFDDKGVSARSARQLSIVADILKSDASRKIHINGHADAKGTDDYNAALSDGRADSIREKLIEYGVGPDQVVTKAFGEAMPRRPNFNPDGTDNPDNRSQNRRAEVYLDF